MSFSYTEVAGRIDEFLNKVQKVSTPSKVDENWLEKISFESTSDKTMRRFISFLGFITRSGEPTELWVQYRDTNKSRGVMARAILSSYSDFYSTYPEAHRESDETLLGIVKNVKKTIADKTARKILSCYRKVCNLANFGGIEKEVDIIEKEEEKQAVKGTRTGITINVNLQLSLPETEKVEVYRSFFTALTEFYKEVEE